MALLSKAEFAEKCGIETKKLSVYRQRGKVVLTTEGLIDDTNPLNIQFYRHQKQLLGKKAAGGVVVKSDKIQPDQPEIDVEDIPEPAKKATKRQKKESDEPDKFDLRFDLDTEKKQAEIKKLKVEAEINSVKQAKMMGKLVPTDLVTALFAQHFKDVTIAFKQAADVLLMEISKKARMGRNEQAEIKGQLIRIINNSVEESVIQSKKSLKNIVEEYSKL